MLVGGIESLRWPARTRPGIIAHSRPDFDHQHFRWSTGRSTIQTGPRAGPRQTILPTQISVTGPPSGVGFRKRLSTRSRASQGLVRPKIGTFVTRPVEHPAELLTPGPAAPRAALGSSLLERCCASRRRAPAPIKSALSEKNRATMSTAGRLYSRRLALLYLSPLRTPVAAP